MNEDDLNDTLHNIEIKVAQTSGQTAARMQAIINQIQSEMGKSMGCSVGSVVTQAVQTSQVSSEDDPWDENDIDVSQAYSYKYIHTLVEVILQRLIEGEVDDNAFEHLKILVKVSKILDNDRVNKGIKLLTVQQVLED